MRSITPPTTVIIINVKLTFSISEVSSDLESEGGVGGDSDQIVVGGGCHEGEGDGGVEGTPDGRSEVLVGGVLAVLDATAATTLKVDTSDRS